MKAYALDGPGKIRDQLLRLLSENEYIDEIMAFDDDSRFMEQVGKSPPDFCFIRLGKDGIPGLTAAGKVHSIRRNIQVVFVSEDGRLAVDAYEVGACGYLTCPLNKEKLAKFLMKKQ